MRSATHIMDIIPGSFHIFTPDQYKHKHQNVIVASLYIHNSSEKY